LEEYARLKSLEKRIELNLAVLEELESLVEDNLEELIEYGQILEEEERILLEKLRGVLQTFQKYLGLLKWSIERHWEDVEVALLELAVKGKLSKSRDDLLGKDVQSKLETLKEFLEFQCSIFGDDIKKLGFSGKVPLDVYTGFLEKISEFNKEIWR